MNVFEDLIVELKEENLLENTVIDTKQPQTKETDVPETLEAFDKSLEEPDVDAESRAASDHSSNEAALVGNAADFEVVNMGDDPPVPEKKPKKSKKLKAGKEFFNKRAVDEMSSLQMVEHIFTGVEREYMKVVPKAFDDFNAKKALHNFLAVTENSQSQEHKAAEFALMQETEAWGLALIERDQKIAVANIRRYCENSRPALSSQAMLALAKFYRNAPYSENVRSKFDFVITRLFSRPVRHDMRVCLFEREEMLGHIEKLYADWSSIPIYEAENDESNVMLTGLSFDDLAAEAESASSFDQLIESDFFGRLRLFKESISELFYAPTVTASAIESNIRIGNAYVNLIVRERQKMDAASIQAKYGDFDDETVSDTAGRSLDLVELLNSLTDEVVFEEFVEDEDEVAESETAGPEIRKAETGAKDAKPAFAGRVVGEVLGINRWILIIGFILIFISGGLYAWSTSLGDEKVSTAGVTALNLDGVLAEHITTGKISRDTFYGLLLPSWDNLTKEKRTEYLQKIYNLGPEKGYKEVSLLSSDGKQAGYASATKLEVYMP